MYSFKNDYSEGAHPRILEALVKTNMEQTQGYGEDPFCARAAELLKQKMNRRDIDIHFISGGTQTNLIAISTFLRPHEAVISAKTGHVEEHETGAIEATGHKIICVDTSNGKLTPQNIQPVLDFHQGEHMVKPRLVYISNSTELGTCYNKKELMNLSAYCIKNNLLLFLDGARLGSALCSQGNDVRFVDLTALTDAFYIGGTKNGALLGEALVIRRQELKEDFRYHIKQKGGLLAKGRLLGIQFLTLFEDNLYFELATHANTMADILKQGIAKAGFSFMSDSNSNQLFPIFPNKIIEGLQKEYDFTIFPTLSQEEAPIRLVTSWATTRDTANGFIAYLQQLV